MRRVVRAEQMAKIETIPEFYRGKKILITGGSGFMGKVLVEKLLRSCPDVHTLYLLLRGKRNKEPSSRIKEITDQPLFDRIRADCPEQFNKLVAVCGDVTQLGLGLSKRDRATLQQEVSVIFHSAASVRFDDPLREAILINVRGTREVIDLALGMTQLKVIVHVSTTYCNFDQPEVLEQIYPAHGDWRSMIQMAERTEDTHLLNCLTPKLLGYLPNTYTYTKSLGEHVINDYRHQLPLVIVRPSIVIASNEEPIPGWLDNLYGPFSLGVGQGKGLLTSMLASPDVHQDYIPVDVAIKAIIFIALHRTYSRSEVELPVYNACNMTVPISFGNMNDQCQIVVTGPLPFEDALWYPTMTVTTCWWLYYLKTIFFQVIPAILLDAMLLIQGRKPRLVKIQRRCYMGIQSLYIFASTQLNFRNDDFIRLSSEMQDSDLKEFDYNKPKLSLEETVLINVKGLKEFVLKESIGDLPKTRAQIRRLYWLHQFTKGLFYLLMICTLASCPLVQALFTARENIPHEI